MDTDEINTYRGLTVDSNACYFRCIIGCIKTTVTVYTLSIGYQFTTE